MLGRKDGRALEQAKPAATEPKSFALPQPYSNMRRVYAYLLHKRHIEREVVSYFTHEKLLYEDEHHKVKLHCVRERMIIDSDDFLPLEEFCAMPSERCKEQGMCCQVR